MSLRINTNIGALTAHRYLQQTDDAMSKSVGKLSSGFRINSAADDPAGLVISESFRANASGLGQALSNTQHATNMVKTAEGAMQEVNNLLRTMRDLAVHAANVGVNDSDAVAADQAQIDKMMESIDRIATTTQFGAKMLLDGSGAIQASVTGTTGAGAATNVRASDTAAVGTYVVTIDTAATKASLVGAGITSATVAAGNLRLNGVDIGITLNMTSANIAAAINGKESESGVHATQAAGVLTLTQINYGAAYTIDTTGSTVALGATGLNLTGGTATAGVDVVAHIGAEATTTGSGQTWSAPNSSAGAGLSMKLTGTGGTVSVTVSGEALTFQLGAYAGQTKSLSLPNMQTSTLFTTAPDVTTGAGAQAALTAIDAAISAVSTARADLGAFQKGTLESNANSLNVAQENIIASESTIRDADMASEMVNFTKSQILMQAGTAMIAQANQAPQYILQMMR